MASFCLTTLVSSNLLLSNNTDIKNVILVKSKAIAQKNTDKATYEEMREKGKAERNLQNSQILKP